MTKDMLAPIGILPTVTEDVAEFLFTLPERAFAPLELYFEPELLDPAADGVFPAANYQGPRSPNLEGLHPDTLVLFTRADQAFFATSGQYLEVESGRRSVERQSELYIGWRLGKPGYNPADVPGISVHNYGFAIDIRRAGDTKVVRALSSTGWTQTVMPKEPWHWEATSAPRYGAARQRRQQMQAQGSLSRKWQEQWETAFAKNTECNRQIDEFNARLQAWKPLADQWRRDAEMFDADVATYNQASQQWNADRERFNQRVDQFNAEIRSLHELRTRIESMPNGPERNRLIQEYNNRNEAARQEHGRLGGIEQELLSRKRNLDNAYAQLATRRQDLERRLPPLNAESAALEKMATEIKAKQAEIQQHLDRARALLRDLAAALGDV